MKVTNEEIYNAKRPLAELLAEKFPVRVAAALANLAVKIDDPLKVIEQTRSGLVKRYGTQDKENLRFEVKPMRQKTDSESAPILDGNNRPTIEENPDYQKFNDDVAELMAIEMEMVLEVVKLPEKVSDTCDKCHHNMDRVLEIKPSILLLLQKFVKVEK